MRTTYKKPLRVEEQIEHIEKNKNVVFNNISKDDAKTLLYEYNYINLITPYKHRFAKKRKDGTTVRDVNHNHIYPNPVEVSGYYQAYLTERVEYPVIYANIMRFETIFNAIVSHEIIHFYKIENYNAFLDFVQELKINALSLGMNKEYTQRQIDKMQDELNEFQKDMDRYEDIYIFMDRLSLSKCITVFRCCDTGLRSKIFKALMVHNATIGFKTFSTFDDALTRIVPIRNFVCHFNSLEILIMYFKIKDKKLRTSTDRKKYKNLIKKLANES